jgi:hypothetical protein
LNEWLRENATHLRRDTAMQQALAGVGDQIWIQAAAEQEERQGVDWHRHLELIIDALRP